jgi:hypothetical protein
MNTISCQASPSLMNSEEKSKAAHYLASTRDNLVRAVTGLSDSQWDFKPAADRWSVAEILEHIVLVENRVHAIIGGMPAAPPAEPDRIDSQIDEVVLAKVPQRLAKVQAGPQVTPSRQWSPAETLKRFLDSRDETLRLLASAPSLRGHVVPHPILGPWDGYQWILAAAAHGSRHTEQILEVKADAGFPDAHSATSV